MDTLSDSDYLKATWPLIPFPTILEDAILKRQIHKLLPPHPHFLFPWITSQSAETSLFLLFTLSLSQSTSPAQWWHLVGISLDFSPFCHCPRPVINFYLTSSYNSPPLGPWFQSQPPPWQTLQPSSVAILPVCMEGSWRGNSSFLTSGLQMQGCDLETTVPPADTKTSVNT